MKHAATIRIALLADAHARAGLCRVRRESLRRRSQRHRRRSRAPVPTPETPYDTASKLYQAGKQAEALVTLQQLAEAGDARAQYLVGLDLIEGKYIKLDYAQGFAYLVLATEDTVWGDLVAPRAREARAVVEPQLSGVDLIHADRLIAAYKQRKK